MSAIDTNMAPSQLNPLGAGGLTGTSGPMDPFVSPAQTPGITSAYQKRRYHTQNRVDAHTDRALRIRDSTEKVAWLYQQRWQTRDVFPLRPVNELVLHIDHFEAYPTFFSVTPEQAVAHMVTQSNTVTEVKLVRFSLQARLTHGFLDETLGQERYAAMLGQFGTSMNETANAEFARALLSASDPQQTWLRRHGEMDIADMQNYMRWDVFIFGALQKISDNPLEKINEKVKSMMKKYLGEADVVIMSEDLQTYAQMVPIRKTRYYMGGQEAVDRVNGRGQGVDSNTGGINTMIDPIRYLQDNRVYIHRSAVVEGQGEIDPWSRRRQYGELNILENTVRDFQRYRSDQRTVFVYNQDADVMSPITMRDLILNCNMFQRDGTLKTLGEDDTAGLSVRYNRDAAYFPFAVRANSYRAIRYCGDLRQVHFNLNDINNLAVTAMNAAYRDVPKMRENDAMSITTVLEEVARRKRGGDQPEAGQVTWAQAREIAVDNDARGRDVATLFDQFAERMRAIMPGSIFLDPRNSLGGGAKSAGRTLYETLVLANAVPIFPAAEGDDETSGAARQDAAFSNLARSLRSLVRPGAATVLAQIDVEINSRDSAQARLERVTQILRENIDSLEVGDATSLNAIIQESTRLYREDLAQAPAADQAADVGATEPAGYINPGAPVPPGFVLGYRNAGGAGAGAGGFVDEEGDEESSVVFQDPDPEEDSAFGDGEDSALEAFNQIPVGLRAVPFFNKVVTAAIKEGMGGGNLGLTRGRRTANLGGVGSGRLGAATERIGASMRDEEFFAQQTRERGFISDARRRLGLVGLNAAQLQASIETLGKNLRDLARHGMTQFRKVMAVIYMGTPFTQQTLLSFYDNDIVIPVTGLLMRPHITVQTRIIAKCQSGGGAGFTYYAHPNVMVGDSVLTKTHTINMSFWLRAHVHAPRNVFIIPDVFVNGYHGGRGVEPILSKQDYDPANMAPGAPCMFYMMCSYSTTRQNLPNPLDISGHNTYLYRMRGAETGGVPGYDTAAFYAALFGFDGSMADLPMMGEAHHNTYCYRAHQEEWDGKGGYTKIEPNTGHWGPKVYAGCKKVIEGELYELETPAWAVGVTSR